MTDTAVHDVVLSGCRPEPLASYLKALGVIRIVTEQKDPEVRGFWRGEHFVLRTALTRDALIRFFIEDWRPTSVIAPWNKGSGFWPSTSDEALRAIEASRDPRLSDYGATIATARRVITELKIVDPPEKGIVKTTLITHLRATVAESALAWLDAAAVLTDADPVYPALLGTGGNDGRQDFSNNFMQRVLTAMSVTDRDALEVSLFAGASRVNVKGGSMGQFSPSALSRSNVWEFLLAVEGTMVLAGAATRRLEHDGGDSLSFPFHARTASGPSIADGEEGHGEIWLPRWANASTFRETRALFAEGRAKTNNGAAATGLDFARSVSSLGVDRGLGEFVRYAFQARNGKNYFAVPLGRYTTGEIRAARLLDDVYLDGWFERFRNKASGKNVPAGVALARRRLEQAMFDAVATGNVGPVLLELGDAERALARSLTFTTKAFLGPAPRLPATWASVIVDGSVEQRLAAALAARPGMHGRLVPLDRTGRQFGRTDNGIVVFGDRPLVDNLHGVLIREDIEAQQATPQPHETSGAARCTLSDIAQFIAGSTDDALIERWLRALVLVDEGLATDVPPDHVLPPTTFAVLSLVHGRLVGDLELPRTAGVLARACAGDAVSATAAALRRLSACARPMPVASLVEPRSRMYRIAAALAFPLTRNQRRRLESMVLPPVQPTTRTFDETSEEQV